MGSGIVSHIPTNFVSAMETAKERTLATIIVHPSPLIKMIPNVQTMGVQILPKHGPGLKAGLLKPSSIQVMLSHEHKSYKPYSR